MSEKVRSIVYVPEEQEDNIITINELTPDDWLQVQLLATQLRNSGQHGGHYGKCWISGFIKWLEYNDKLLSYDEDDSSHH